MGLPCAMNESWGWVRDEEDLINCNKCWFMHMTVWYLAEMPFTTELRSFDMVWVVKLSRFLEVCNRIDKVAMHKTWPGSRFAWYVRGVVHTNLCSISNTSPRHGNERNTSIARPCKAFIILPCCTHWGTKEAQLPHFVVQGNPKWQAIIRQSERQAVQWDLLWSAPSWTLANLDQPLG